MRDHEWILSTRNLCFMGFSTNLQNVVASVKTLAPRVAFKILRIVTKNLAADLFIPDLVFLTQLVENFPSLPGYISSLEVLL